jgi:GNAT superfamily N-acetyltransferase
MESSPPIEIRIVELEPIIDLRWRILRAGLDRSTAYFDGDREPTTRHLAAFSNGTVVGCATILQRPWQDRAAWQLRGMAVEPRFQGRGIGTMLLMEIESIVRRERHSLQLWCNARTPATAFYEKMGWSRVGDEFVIPTAGPHFKMRKALDGKP